MILKWPSKAKQWFYRTVIRKAYLYLKYRVEINSGYGYALKNGYAQDETYNWLNRTNYWLRSE